MRGHIYLSIDLFHICQTFVHEMASKLKQIKRNHGHRVRSNKKTAQLLSNNNPLIWKCMLANLLTEEERE